MADLNIEAMAYPQKRDPLDYSGLQNKIASTTASAAASTRNVNVSPLPGGLTDNLYGEGKKLGQATIGDYYTQVDAQRQQAEKSAQGIEMMGAQTQSTLQGLENVRALGTGQYTSMVDSFNAPSEKADEFVTAVRARVGESLGVLEKIHSQMDKDMGFAKAHDMQVAVQGVLGSMKTEERNILQTYGAQSKEYESFMASKSMSLATAQSMIHSSYMKLTHERDLTYMNAVNESMSKHNMYTGFQEQQLVDTLKWKADSKQAAWLQYSELLLGLERAQGDVMSQYTDFIYNSPNFTVEAAPTVSILADLSQAAKDERNAKMTEMRSRWDINMAAMVEGASGHKLSNRGTIGSP